MKVKKENIIVHAEEAEIYDKIHVEIFNKFEQKRIWRNIIKIIRFLGDKLYYCLDIGCGTGNLTIKEAIFFKQVIGVDISNEMLRNARQKIIAYGFSNVEFVIADCERLPFKKNIFNLCSAFSVFHHLPNITKALAEIYQVLRVNGFFLLGHEPNMKKFRKIADYGWLFMSVIRLIRFKKLASLNKNYNELMKRLMKINYSIADVHAEKGYNVSNITMLMKKIGFTPILIYYNYLFIFSILPKPLNLFSYIFFFLDKLPIFKKFSNTITFIVQKI